MFRERRSPHTTPSRLTWQSEEARFQVNCQILSYYWLLIGKIVWTKKLYIKIDWINYSTPLPPETTKWDQRICQISLRKIEFFRSKMLAAITSTFFNDGDFPLEPTIFFNNHAWPNMKNSLVLFVAQQSKVSMWAIHILMRWLKQSVCPNRSIMQT